MGAHISPDSIGAQATHTTRAPRALGTTAIDTAVPVHVGLIAPTHKLGAPNPSQLPTALPSAPRDDATPPPGRRLPPLFALMRREGSRITNASTLLAALAEHKIGSASPGILPQQTRVHKQHRPRRSPLLLGGFVLLASIALRFHRAPRGRVWRGRWGRRGGTCGRDRTHLLGRIHC